MAGVQKQLESFSDALSTTDNAIRILNEIKEYGSTPGLCIKVIADSGLGKRVKKLASSPDKEVQQIALAVLKVWMKLPKTAPKVAEKRKREESPAKEPAVVPAAAAPAKVPRAEASTGKTLASTTPVKETDTPANEVGSSDASKSLTAEDRAAIAERTRKAQAMLASVESGPRKAVVEVLGKALSVGVEDANLLWYPKHPLEMACQIEAALLAKHGEATAPEYRAHVRTLNFNLKNAKNAELREFVLLGSLPPANLVEMSPHDLADPDLKAERQKHSEYFIEAAKSEHASEGTDLYKCNKCGKRNTKYYLMQTRSADEPMTTFISCLTKGCGNRWKF